MEILKFGGVYKDYLWGGSKMRDKFGIKTDISPLAESWVLSCHKDGMCIIAGGEYAGVSLSEYIKKNPDALGTACKTKELPILIKFIDAAQNLSVQVHPNDELAKKWENQNGKTEMWYVVQADEGSKIIYGMKDDTEKEALSDAIKDNTVENLLNCALSKKGDVFFVEAGTVHAIGGGNLIAEIQQNSNVTYRLYDYARVGKDGKPRELHIEKGVASSNTKKVKPRCVCDCSDGTKMIGSCEFFHVREVVLSEKRSFCADEKSYHAIMQTEGSSVISWDGKNEKVTAGEVAFIPAGLGEYTVEGDGVVLLVKNPPEYIAKVTKNGEEVTAVIVDEYGVVYESSGICKNADEAVSVAAEKSGIKAVDISKTEI